MNKLEWNKLDPSLCNSESFLAFKKNVLQFIRPVANSVYNCHKPKGIELIRKLRLGLSHLREQELKHNFQESSNPLWNCGHGIKSTSHFCIVHCSVMKDTLSSAL